MIYSIHLLATRSTGSVRNTETEGLGEFLHQLLDQSAFAYSARSTHYISQICNQPYRQEEDSS